MGHVHTNAHKLDVEAQGHVTDTRNYEGLVCALVAFRCSLFPRQASNKVPGALPANAS